MRIFQTGLKKKKIELLSFLGMNFDLPRDLFVFVRDGEEEIYFQVCDIFHFAFLLSSIQMLATGLCFDVAFLVILRNIKPYQNWFSVCLSLYLAYVFLSKVVVPVDMKFGGKTETVEPPAQYAINNIVPRQSLREILINAKRYQRHQM